MLFNHNETKILAKVLKSIEQDPAPASRKGLVYGLTFMLMMVHVILMGLIKDLRKKYCLKISFFTSNKSRCINT